MVITTKPKQKRLLDSGDRISVNIGMTIQVQERNYVKLDLGGETALRPGESVKQAQDRLFEALETTLNDKIDEYVESLK